MSSVLPNESHCNVVLSHSILFLLAATSWNRITENSEIIEFPPLIIDFNSTWVNVLLQNVHLEIKSPKYNAKNCCRVYL